jgi:hypothetical protein
MPAILSGPAGNKKLNLAPGIASLAIRFLNKQTGLMVAHPAEAGQIIDLQEHATASNAIGRLSMSSPRKILS